MVNPNIVLTLGMITIIFPNYFIAKSLAEANLNDVRIFFGNDLDIAEDLIVVNARLPQSTEMMEMRRILRHACDRIKVKLTFSQQNSYKESCCR